CEEVGYLNHVSRFRMFPFVADALRRLNESGYPVIVVSNQSGVARGYFPLSLLQEVTGLMEQQLAESGARVDAVYYCSHASSVDLRDLAECVEKFSGKTIVLLGDFVADEFRYGDISRVSREAPVLILKHRETHVLPGGGANATNNLASLGAKVLPITVVGGDQAGDALIQYFRGKGISTGGILRAKGRATPTKT